MTLFEALILGLIQGLTEFLPISSSAHVQIAQQLLDLSNLSKPELTAFIATIQIGTELAVVLYFAKDIFRILGAWFGSLSFKREKLNQDAKMGWLIIVGSVPIVVLGLLLRDFIENDVRSLWVISYTLIGFGLILGIADRFGSKVRHLDQLNVPHGIWFGLGQALALVPGVSRSGGTISVGLALGYTREAAARYSFLLAIPAVLASGIYQFAKSFGDLSSEMLVSTVAATAVSFVVGLSVIHFLLRYLQKGSFMPFVVWRVAIGGWLLLSLMTGQIVA